MIMMMMMMMLEHSAIDLFNRMRAVICPCPFYWVQQSSVYRVYVYGRQTALSFGDLLMTRVLARAQSAVLSLHVIHVCTSYNFDLIVARPRLSSTSFTTFLAQPTLF